MSACLDCGGSECICRFRSRVVTLRAEVERLRARVAELEATVNQTTVAYYNITLGQRIAALETALRQAREPLAVYHVPGETKLVDEALATIDAALGEGDRDE